MLCCLVFCVVTDGRAQADSIIRTPGIIEQDAGVFKFFYFGQFGRHHWELLRDSQNPNAVTFNSSTESHTGSVYSDIVTDYVSNVQVCFATMYTVAPNDSSMAYHNLFNGGGNGILKVSYPLLFAGRAKPNFNRYAGLVFAPRMGLYLPQVSGASEMLMNKDIGVEILFGLVTDNRLISFSGALRTSYTYGRNEYVSRLFTEGTRNFAYQLLTLSLKIKQFSFSTRMPLRIWYRGESIRNLPAFISLAVNY